MITLPRDLALRPRSLPVRPPRWARDFRPLLPVLLLLAVAAVGWGAWGASVPSSLDQTTLGGQRLLTGRACIAIAADLSGSMSDFAVQRQQATEILVPWLRRNLRGDDQVAMVAFTDQGELLMPATAVAELPPIAPVEPALPGQSTEAVPALDLLDVTLDDEGCSATALLMISDGLLGDRPSDLAGALSRAGITRTYLINPNGSGRPAELSDPRLSGIRVVALGDADQQALTYGRAVADLTGQELRRE